MNLTSFGNCSHVSGAQFHKDYFEELPRFPDFFVTFRILSSMSSIIFYINLLTYRIPILFFSFLSLGFHWLAVSWPSRLLEAKVHRSQPPVYSSHCHAWAVGFILSQELFFGSILCCELLETCPKKLIMHPGRLVTK